MTILDLINKKADQISFFVVTFFIFSIPNLIFFINTNLTDILLISFLISFLLLSLFNKTSSIIFFPFYLISPFYLYYLYYYQSLPNEQTLNIIFETNSDEVLSYFGFGIFISFAIYFLWFIFCIYFFKKNAKKYIFKYKLKNTITFIILLSFIIIYYLENTALKNNPNFVEGDNFLSKEENTLKDKIKKTFPLGFFITIEKTLEEQKKINDSYNKNKNFKFNVTENNKKNNKIFVLVIGETSRRKNWKLNGYNRNTTPNLMRENNLVNFNNMLSISSATRSSIPMIITRKPQEYVYKYEFPELSIVSAFKEAGYTTFWLSTQQKYGEFDTSTSVYAKEADKVIFLNSKNYTESSVHDSILIDQLNKIIIKPGKKFIVIHTLGSHANYADRYPENFNIFTPSLKNFNNNIFFYKNKKINIFNPKNRENKKEILNSYDNSILFTDYILSSFIEILKNQNNHESFLLYSSDHGEDLFDDGCNKSGHGNTTIYNYEIAAFAWYSDLYKKNNPEKIAWLKKNKNRKINQTSIFPTLIDAAKFSIANDSLNRSLLKNFHDYSRLVNGVIDFDKTLPQGMCKEIQ